MSVPAVGVGGAGVEASAGGRVNKGVEVASSAAPPVDVAGAGVGAGVVDGAVPTGAGVGVVLTGSSTPPLVGAEGPGVLVPGGGMITGAGVAERVLSVHDDKRSGHSCPFSLSPTHLTYPTN